MEIAQIQSDALTTTAAVNREQKRVLFIDHTAKMGGGEIALLNLVPLLNTRQFKPSVLLLADGPLAAALRAQDVDVIVLPIDGEVLNTRKESLGGSSLLKLRAAWNVSRAVMRVRRLIRRGGFDLVHTNSLKADIIGGLAGRLAGKKVVWHVRDRIDDDYLPPRVARLFRFLARRVPHFVVANSNAVLKSLHMNAETNVASATSSDTAVKRTRGIVYEGTPVGERNDDAAIQDWSRPTIVLVGRLAHWKGQHVFIEAASLVHKQYPSARFQIIGSAMFAEKDYEDGLRAQIERLRLRDVVEMTGFRSDVPQLMAAAHIAVHASVTGEPFGQVITEAMALSKPVIATRGGGVPEIVNHGDTGLLVAMGDAPAMAEAMRQLLADPAAAVAMGHRGYDRVKNCFTIQHTAAGVRQVHQELLGVS